MATPSPTSSTFTSLTPPSKQSLNSHPYAIKSSSSGILTRSASSPSHTSTQHHYVPLITTSPSPGNGRYVLSRKHSYPAVGATPSPIPTPDIPPTPPLTLRVKRRETAPTTSWPSRSDTEQGLPANPKLWTPSHLATYLSSALRLTGGAKLPVPVARDIAAFVVRERLGGRAFLRMTREDYDSLGINTLWKSALSDASRSLRQNLVRGRIMGFGNGASTSLDDLSLDIDEEDDDLQVSLDLHAAASLTQSPSSYTPWDRKRTLGRFKAGRVKGMVENFERSSSESGSEGEWETWKGKRGESGSGDGGGEVGVEVMNPESGSGSEDGGGKVGVEVMYPESGSGSEDGGGKVGVEVMYPESGSGSSASEDGMAFDSEEMNVPLPVATSTSTTEFLVQPESAPEESIFSPAAPGLPATIESGIGFSTPTNPNTDPEPGAESEPSVETLLRTAPLVPEAGPQPRSWGAKAWEDEGAHTTAKRVPLSEDNAVSGMAMGAGSVEEVGVVEKGSVKRVNGRKKVKRAEGLAKLFERRANGAAKNGGIEDEGEGEIKDGAEGGVVNQSDSELGTTVRGGTNGGAETLVQQTVKRSCSQPFLDPTLATHKDRPEGESEFINHDLHIVPLSSLDVTRPPPILDENTDVAETLVQQTTRGSFSQLVLDPTLATHKDGPEGTSTFINLDFPPGPLPSLVVNGPLSILDVSLLSSDLPTETDISSLESEVPVPHLPLTVPVYKDIPVSSSVASASSLRPSGLLLESPPAQPISDLTALSTTTSELQTALVAVQERLEIVENRLEELEAREAEREAELKQLQRAGIERAVQAEQEDLQTDRQDLIADWGGVSSQKNYAAPNPSLGSLPAYVLVASLGIASVVVGSFIKSGRRRDWGR
ncbi:hypothetical protein BU17DRAFT_81478 [Hysterangium stoloniferum]|nr:hypothetical protein BU17DRAFT_81478 [Hysterangium stoloniferum]